MMLPPKLRLIKMIPFWLIAASLAGMTGCKKNTDQDQTQASDAAAIRDMQEAHNTGGGRFDVICKNGDRETRTDREIEEQEVCEGRRPPYGGGPNYGTAGRSAVDCARQAILMYFSSEEAAQLCAGARDTSPVDCARQAILGGMAKKQTIRLCSPQFYHPPYPRPGHGGYPQPAPYPGEYPPPVPYYGEHFNPRPN